MDILRNIHPNKAHQDYGASSGVFVVHGCGDFGQNGNACGGSVCHLSCTFHGTHYEQRETPATTISVSFTTTNNNGQRLAVALGTPLGARTTVDSNVASSNVDGVVTNYTTFKQYIVECPKT